MCVFPLFSYFFPQIWWKKNQSCCKSPFYQWIICRAVICWSQYTTTILKTSMLACLFMISLFLIVTGTTTALANKHLPHHLFTLRWLILSHFKPLFKPVSESRGKLDRFTLTIFFQCIKKANLQDSLEHRSSRCAVDSNLFKYFKNLKYLSIWIFFKNFLCFTISLKSHTQLNHEVVYRVFVE